MKFSKTWAVTLAIVGLLALVFSLWYNAPSARQARADAHLRKAILHNDTRGVLDALGQGANPNAVYLFPSLYDTNPTLWQQVKNAYHHILPDPPLALSPLACAILPNHLLPNGLPATPPENTAIVEALLRRGANPNVLVWSGHPLIMITAETNKAATINLLLRYGANVNAHDGAGETTLMGAAQDGQCAVAETLLDHGANVNGQGMLGQTALMQALIGNAQVHPETERLPMVRLLLRHHANVSLRNDDGNTVLTLARRQARWSHEDPATMGPIIALLQAKARPAP